MSLSDCEKCWDTPCMCGYGYRDWTEEGLREHISMLQKVLAECHTPPSSPEVCPVCDEERERREMVERALAFWPVHQHLCGVLADFAESEVTRTLNQLREGVDGLMSRGAMPSERAALRWVLALIDKAKPEAVRRR